MIDVIAGVVMIGGGALMLGSAVPMSRIGARSAEVVAALPFTPLPAPDAELEALILSID